MCRKLKYLVSFVLVLSLTASVTKADIIAYWPFDQGTGDVAHYVVGGFDAQLTNIDWVAGQFEGSALECDRSGDEIFVGPGPTPTTNDLSIAWWMVDNYDSSQTMMNKNETDSVAGNNILLRPEGEDSPLRFRIGGWQAYGGWGSECRVPQGAYSDGEWVHVVCTYDSTTDTATIYINGELAANGDYNPKTTIAGPGGYCDGVNEPTQPLYIVGQREAFGGIVDEVAIWDHALTPDEVLAVYTLGPLDPRKASKPNLDDEATDVPGDVVLSWEPGEFANTHDVYFGTVFGDVNDADRTNPLGVLASQGQSASTYAPGRLDFGQTYYWRIDEVNAPPDSTIFKGYTWSFVIPPRTAYEPDPADGAKYVDPNVVLSWSLGFGAMTHTVYFGDDFNTVNNAAGGFPQGGTTYTPGPLELEKTYYWRIDEVEADGTTIHKGDVWSFTVADRCIGVAFDLQKYVDQCLKAGQQRIVIPPGQYRVAPRNQQHLVLQNLLDIEIIAQGVEMICTETTRAMSISDCRNMTVCGLTIDYDPLPYTQGTIVKLSRNDTVHDIELFDGYPTADHVDDFKYEIFRADRRTLRFGSYQFSVEILEPKRIRVTRGGSYRGEQVGDIIAIGICHAPGGQIPHAVYTTDCENVVLEDITLYASNCFGFFETQCSRTTYRRCVVDRRSAADDLKQREDPRIRSLNADAFHSKYAVVGPQVIDCVAHFQGDDCININGNYHMVMASEEVRWPVSRWRDSEKTWLRVLAKGDLNIQSGDPLEVVTYDGHRLPDANAVSTKRIGIITDEELAFLAVQRLHKPFKEGSLRDMYEVVIDRSIDLARGSIICAANRVGNGFKVTGCDFGFNRSRGILIKASHGEVTNNTLEGCWGEAIKVAPEYWWLEAGSSNDVLITGNRITNCLGMGIAVYARAGAGGIAPVGAHNDIMIEGNTITNTAGTDIWVTSTRGLILRDNNLDAGRPDVILERCEDVWTDISTYRSRQLSEALDTVLTLTTGGSADWFSQTTTYRHGADAAQSGDISNNQDSWMQTTVSGKGTVKFYWKVSSEEDFDFLEFYIDGSLQEKISGSVNWQQKTYTFYTSGSHALEWRYIKDGSVGSGSDCGWVDKVEWVAN